MLTLLFTHRIDTIVLGILILCFFNFQLDRTNMLEDPVFDLRGCEGLTVTSGNALTDNFLVDVGITQNWFNVGQQLLNAGIVLLEVSGDVVCHLRLGCSGKDCR